MAKTRLGGTVLSCKDQLAEVYDDLRKGRIDRHDAKVASDIIKGMVAAIRTEHDHGEMDEARKLYRDTLAERNRIEATVREARRDGIVIDDRTYDADSDVEGVN